MPLIEEKAGKHGPGREGHFERARPIKQINEVNCGSSAPRETSGTKRDAPLKGRESPRCPRLTWDSHTHTHTHTHKHTHTHTRGLHMNSTGMRATAQGAQGKARRQPRPRRTPRAVISGGSKGGPPPGPGPHSGKLATTTGTAGERGASRGHQAQSSAGWASLCPGARGAGAPPPPPPAPRPPPSCGQGLTLTPPALTPPTLTLLTQVPTNKRHLLNRDPGQSTPGDFSTWRRPCPPASQLPRTCSPPHPKSGERSLISGPQCSHVPSLSFSGWSGKWNPPPAPKGCRVD